jgi:hypothetical protein
LGKLRDSKSMEKAKGELLPIQSMNAKKIFVKEVAT